MNERARRGPRRRFNYANVMSTLTFFLVVAGGSAQALSGHNTVFSDDIVDGAVKSPDLRNDAVTSAKIRNGGVRNPDLLNGSVTSAKIRDGQVTTPDLATNAVNSGKVADESLTGADVAAGSLSGDDIAVHSLLGAHIVNNTLGGEEIQESSLGQVPSAQLGGFGRSAGTPLGTKACNPNSLTLVVCTQVDLNLPAQTRVLVIGQIEAFDGGSGTCELGTGAVDLPSTATPFRTGASDTDNGTLVGVTPPLGPGTVVLRIRCNESKADIAYGPSEIAAVALSPS